MVFNVEGGFFKRLDAIHELLEVSLSLNLQPGFDHENRLLKTIPCHIPYLYGRAYL